MMSPCKNCSERSPCCHGKCERFAEFRNQLADQKKKQRIETGSEYRRYYFDNNNMKNKLKYIIKQRMKRRG